MKKNKKFALTFTESEMKDREVSNLLNKLIEAKVRSQRHSPSYELSELEVEAIKRLHTFVPKDKYKETKFKGEVGKFNGKRVVLVKDEVR